MAFFEDQIFIGGLIIGFLAFGFLAILLVSNINTAFASADVDQVGKNVVSGWDSQLPSIVDWFFGLLFIGLPLIALGLAFVNFIPSFFFWVAMLVSAVITVLGFALQTAYEAVVSSAAMADVASRIPVTNFFMDNMGIYAIFVWLLIAIGTYVKTNQSGGMGY